MLFSPCYFFHPPEIDFVSVAGQSDHALLFINHNASHAFAVPVVEIGTHTHTSANKLHAHIQKSHTHKHKKRVPAVRKRATVLPTSTVA